MARKAELLLRIRQQYRKQTGKTEIDHKEVARFAVKMGWKPPKPKDPIELLAREISEAARQEERIDRDTGHPYRANLSYSMQQGQEQIRLWVDTDEADRKQIERAKNHFRSQLVGEAFRLYTTLDHWSRTHPDDEPVQAELDLGPDVLWMLHSEDEDKKAS